MVFGKALGKIKAWLAVAGAVVLAIVGAYLKGKATGRSDEKAAANERTLDQMRKAKEIEDEIEVLDDVGLGTRAGEWLRK